MSSRRQFGRVRRLPSGRYQARYLTGDGRLHRAPETFASKRDADRFLAVVETELARGTWFDPTASNIRLETLCGTSDQRCFVPVHWWISSPTFGGGNDMDVTASVVQLANQVRAALAGSDLDAFAGLLDPKVTWGAGGDPSPGCRNRRQVLEWYRRGYESGTRANIIDVATNQDKILVSMAITGRESTDGEAATSRWQVLTVTEGRVSDIRGYEEYEAARIAAGLTD